MNGDGKQLHVDEMQLKLEGGNYLVIRRDDLTRQLAVIKSPMMTTLDSMGLLVNAMVGVVQALYSEQTDKKIIELPPGVKIVEKS